MPIEERNEYYEILNNLINENNIEMKTEIHKPLLWSSLTIIKDFLNSKQLIKSSDILRNFITTSFKYYVSYKRKSRKEIVEALKNSMELSEPSSISNVDLKTLK